MAVVVAIAAVVVAVVVVVVASVTVVVADAVDVSTVPVAAVLQSLL